MMPGRLGGEGEGQHHDQGVDQRLVEPVDRQHPGRARHGVGRAPHHRGLDPERGQLLEQRRGDPTARRGWSPSGRRGWSRPGMPPRPAPPPGPAGGAGRRAPGPGRARPPARRRRPWHRSRSARRRGGRPRPPARPRRRAAAPSGRRGTSASHAASPSTSPGSSHTRLSGRSSTSDHLAPAGQHGIGGELGRERADGHAGRGHGAHLSEAVRRGRRPSGRAGPVTGVRRLVGLTGRRGRAMQVQFNVRQFLDRAAVTYPERVAVVDEPDQPAEPWEPLTFAAAGRPGPGPGRRSRPPGHRPGRAGGRRLPQLGPAPDVLLRRLRLGTHPRADQLPPGARPRSSTSSSTPAPSVLLVDPELDEALAGIGPERRYVLGPEADAELYAHGVEPVPWDVRRVGHRHHQLHLGHHRPAEGRPAHPPQLLGQLRRLRLARRRVRPRRLPPHPADVPRQRLGHAVDHRGHGRDPGGPAQGRRPRDPAPGRPPRRHPAVRGAGRGQRRPRRRSRLGGPGARGGHHPRRGGRRAAAVPDHRADRVRARLGVHPDLRADRDVAGPDRQPGPGRVGRPPLGPAGPQAHAGRCAGHRHRAHRRRARRGAGPVQHRHGRLLAPARGVRRRRWPVAGSTPATAGRSTRRAT